MKKKLIPILLFILVVSCSLDHSNPLDPEKSGIPAPSEITGIHVVLDAQNHVNISWNTQPEVDGYYIYRSFSEDGEYDKLSALSTTTSSYLDLITITNYHSWYKLSAYIIIEADSLEGIRSAPHTWNN